MSSHHNSAKQLDPELCRRARLARDRRFDGEFFLAVKTTGIYCRPICPARLPAEKNVRYFRLASQAAAAGYRPCLRCRPESAPGSPAWRGTSTTVARALRLIEEGALADGNLADLAARLGIGERYLRKLFQQELGVSPQAVALNQRLLFANKLLAETALPLTEVAFAAGFGSVRRFNSAVKAHFGLTPGDLRGRKKQPPEAGIRLQLQYRPPYDWPGVVDFLAHHAVAGVEEVTENHYRRQFRTAAGPGWLQVSPLPGKNALELQLQVADNSQLLGLVVQLRRMFDLDANPAQITARLQGDPALAPLAEKSPGARSPGHWSLYEAAVRAIVGQQVSTAAARTVLSRLAAACAGDGVTGFPAAADIAALPDQHFPMPARRRETLRSLCRHFAGREEQLDLEALAALKGVGPWTVAMVAVRGAGDPDVFPAGDLGLERSWAALAGSAGTLKDAAQHWRPWRSYAANLLWRNYSP
ncbi:helix-turn-helix domain-containing protein [Seongchinamella sediminis]|uniref:DNA-3-methyladenine glycosylase II n=1 Tax=Seongchinamella sediminis TaxID=2283635 RepID=A0A3L7E1I4_9GAMM|nr:AlkA N-terminal domain-containing protein [Seongchinamella sediminis]RLQ22203.1 helix-turn-helix domain-containing protein [Seongchinamella sediminis]